VWNTGGYHWEEKSVGKWSEEKLKEIIGGFKYQFPGGELKALEVKKLTGEAGVSIRKGKKIVTYEY
jgi:activator of HSP90 ATPase